MTRSSPGHIARYFVIPIALFGAPSLATSSNETQVKIASKAIGGWQVDVTQTISTKGEQSHLRNLHCTLFTPGMQLFVFKDSIEPRFNYDQYDDKSAKRRLIVHLLVTSVQIDDKAPYQASYISSPRLSYLGIRKSPRSPWLRLSGLVSELASSRIVRIRFDDPVNTSPSDKENWFTIRTENMGEALKWCQDVMASEQAYRFKQGSAD